MPTGTQAVAETRLSMHSTLIWGGGGLALGSALPLIRNVTLDVGATNAVVETVYYASLASGPILCVALLILAFGLPGEFGIGGRSLLATVSITVLAGLLLIGALEGLFLLTMLEPQAMAYDWYFTGRYFLTAAAAIIAAVAVQRAGVLTGLALSGGVIVVLFNVAITVLSRFFVGLLMEQNQAAIAVFMALGTLAVLAQIALGILYFWHGWRQRIPASSSASAD